MPRRTEDFCQFRRESQIREKEGKGEREGNLAGTESDEQCRKGLPRVTPFASVLAVLPREHVTAIKPFNIRTYRK